MSTQNDYWLTVWNKKADEKSSPYATMGRGDYDLPDYLLYMSDVAHALGGVSSSDVLLDAGGGIGFASMYFSPHVNSVYLCDYSVEMIKEAAIQTKSFKNVRCYVDNVQLLEKTKALDMKFDKIVIGSVLQYFNSVDEISGMFENLSKLCQESAKVVITHNPDLRKKDAFLKSYNDLDWSQERINKALAEEENRLWIDPERCKELAESKGFAAAEESVISPQLFQSTHMFDLVLTK